MQHNKHVRPKKPRLKHLRMRNIWDKFRRRKVAIDDRHHEKSKLSRRVLMALLDIHAHLSVC